MQLFPLRFWLPVGDHADWRQELEYYGFYDSHRMVIYLYENYKQLKSEAAEFRKNPMYRWQKRYVLADVYFHQAIKVELLA